MQEMELSQPLGRAGLYFIKTEFNDIYPALLNATTSVVAATLSGLKQTLFESFGIDISCSLIIILSNHTKGG